MFNFLKSMAALLSLFPLNVYWVFTRNYYQNIVALTLSVWAFFGLSKTCWQKKPSPLYKTCYFGVRNTKIRGKAPWYVKFNKC